MWNFFVPPFSKNSDLNSHVPSFYGGKLAFDSSHIARFLFDLSLFCKDKYIRLRSELWFVAIPNFVWEKLRSLGICPQSFWSWCLVVAPNTCKPLWSLVPGHNWWWFSRNRTLHGKMTLKTPNEVYLLRWHSFQIVWSFRHKNSFCLVCLLVLKHILFHSTQ